MSEITGAVRRHTRALFASGIYRWLIGCAFLFVAFSDFPTHKWTIGLGYVVLSTAISALVEFAQLQHAAENLLADRAERKTRHTIIMAAEWAAHDGPMNSPEFWGTVDGRVNDEMNVDEKAGFWTSAVLVVGGVIWRTASDLFGLALVAALSSSSSY